jgi:transcriptional regulator with XRE-family HTH domain
MQGSCNMKKASHANDALIQARKRRGWKEKDIAAQVPVNEKTYRRWEHGELIPSLRHLRRLCELFETTPDALGFDLNEGGGNE